MFSALNYKYTQVPFCVKSFSNSFFSSRCTEKEYPPQMISDWGGVLTQMGVCKPFVLKCGIVIVHLMLISFLFQGSCFLIRRGEKKYGADSKTLQFRKDKNADRVSKVATHFPQCDCDGIFNLFLKTLEQLENFGNLFFLLKVKIFGRELAGE